MLSGDSYACDNVVFLKEAIGFVTVFSVCHFIHVVFFVGEEVVEVGEKDQSP